MKSLIFFILVFAIGCSQTEDFNKSMLKESKKNLIYKYEKLSYNQRPDTYKYILKDKKCSRRVSNLYEDCDYKKLFYIRLVIDPASAKFLNYYGHCGGVTSKGLCAPEEQHEKELALRFSDLFGKYNSKINVYNGSRELLGTGIQKNRIEVLEAKRKDGYYFYILGAYEDFSKVTYQAGWVDEFVISN